MTHTNFTLERHSAYADDEPLLIPASDGCPEFISYTAVIGNGRKIVAQVVSYSDTGNGFPRPETKAEADAIADRLIHCWNEYEAVKQDMNDARSNWESATEELNAVCQQRNELLDALKEATRIMLRAGLIGAASKAQEVVEKVEDTK